MDPGTLALAKDPDLRIGHGILEPYLASLGSAFALVGQPGPIGCLDAVVVGRAAALIEATSLDETALEALLSDLPAVDRVVGVGGGVVMDTTKYLAWRSGLPLVLAPSAISVDAAVTNSVALRRNGSVEYEGFVTADAIIADLELIASAPRRLNRAGVGDILSIQTARADWALGAKAGRIDLDTDVDAAAARSLVALYDMADEVAAVTDRALEHVIRAYVRVNAICLDVGHSGPEEGSEHYFAYAAEAVTGRTFVHGELIGLGVVLMAGLQGNGDASAAAFLDRCRVEWRPERLGLDRAALEAILARLPSFVREAGLPYSIIDETAFDGATVTDLIASIPVPIG